MSTPTTDFRKNSQAKLSLPARWYLVTTTGLLILVVLYLYLHTSRLGSVYIKLTTQEIVDIGNIFNSPLTPNKPADTTLQTTGVKNLASEAHLNTLFYTQREQVFRYLFGKYRLQTEDGQSDTAAFRHNFSVYDTEREFVGALANYPLRVASYFWLANDWLYIEVIFWTLFGVIASLLYNVSEALRKSGVGFDRAEIPVHIAKIFYAPLSAIVIFLSIDLLTTDGSVNIVRVNAGVIVLSFILGFFSGRTIELLNKIKELILPVSTDKTPHTKTVDSVDVIAGEPVPVAIIDEAIQTYSEAWVALYPNVVGIASKQKYVNGKQTDRHSIVFEVTKKETNLEQGKIPAFINYVTSDNRVVQIPTDVFETGKITASTLIFDLDKAMMGGSVSAKGQTAVGTMGLKLFAWQNNQKDYYLLSCYHVLCAQALTQQITAVEDTTIEVIVPSQQDNGGQVIGKVKRGKLDATHDFALVALDNPAFLNNKIYGHNNAPNGTTVVSSFDNNTRVVYLAGRTSEGQHGRITAHLWEGRIQFTSDFAPMMRGVVQTTRISDKGDSGAAVVDTEGRVVGLLIADDEANQFSYILPINQFLSDHNLTIDNVSFDTPNPLLV